MRVSRTTNAALGLFAASVFFGPLDPGWLLLFAIGCLLGDWLRPARQMYEFTLPNGAKLRVFGASRERAEQTAESFGAAVKRGEF